MTTDPRFPAAEPATPAEPATSVAPAAPTRDTLAPRTSPIVWGSLVLVFCAYVFARMGGWSVDTTTWIIATIIGVGALLLVVGVAVLLRSSKGTR